VCGTAFGFCEFEDPEATLRCMRLLNDWVIADKKLVVRIHIHIDMRANRFKVSQ